MSYYDDIFKKQSKARKLLIIFKIKNNKKQIPSKAIPQ
ncbi:uncharacterized protein CHAB577_0662 [Chlamydia abortus]|nr:uncharacterized protein CHAB577_0662 [Chlamydia abortus]